MNFIKVLGYGLTGLGFLFMYLAFGLIKSIIQKGNSERNVYVSVWLFMGLTLAMTIAIGTFTYITQDYKTTELNNSESANSKLNRNFVALKDINQNTIDKMGLLVNKRATIDQLKTLDSLKKISTTLSYSLSTSSISGRHDDSAEKVYLDVSRHYTELSGKILESDR